MFLSVLKKEVKKDFQPKPDPFSQVIGCRGESNINLITNFAFEETSTEAEVLCKGFETK
jgi:hypothetical protein